MDALNGAVVTALVQAGVLGPIVGWLMLRTDRRLERLEAAINRMTRAYALSLFLRPDLTAPVRKEARSLIQETDQAMGRPSTDV